MTATSIMSAGLTRTKVDAIRGPAEWFVANRSTAKVLSTLFDEHVIAILVGVPGIGLWTANVFLIFNLGRLDVMPVSDLGNRRGVQMVCELGRVATAREIRDRAQL